MSQTCKGGEAVWGRLGYVRKLDFYRYFVVLHGDNWFLSNRGCSSIVLNDIVKVES